jgi:hypothetical protein
VEHFFAKNKDTTLLNITEMLQKATLPFISQTLFSKDAVAAAEAPPPLLSGGGRRAKEE